MQVYKSDGTYEEYSQEKVKNSICEAYRSVNEVCPEAFLSSFVNNLFIYDKISTHEIRRQVEDALMSIEKKVAKSYISKHKEIAEKGGELKKKASFIKDYVNASNAATGAKYDSNANVNSKNIVTMGQELYKINNIRQNRYMMQEKLTSLYSKKLSKQYVMDIESHLLYRHDETAMPGMPYCVSITMYPFLIDGLKKIGGESIAPTDLKSFCGGFVNLLYSTSSQFAGAVATPEWLMYLDYFIRKDYGDDYLGRLEHVVEFNRKNRTLEKVIENSFQQVVHSMNMPAGNRGYQTVFWNIGYFDENYFNGVFDGFIFPDGTKPQWETLSWLQKKFMKWFNEEREKYKLTFPVETMALLTDGEDVLDKDYADFTAQMWAEGHSFFCYLSDSPDSLSSCCRLRSSISKDYNENTHQYSMGTTSIATGSKSVITINLNRLTQDAVRYLLDDETPNNALTPARYGLEKDGIHSSIKESLTNVVNRIHKYHTAFNNILKDFYNAKMLTIYSGGFIDMKKQYLTIGVNGLTDAAEFLGLDIGFNDEYNEFANLILETINKLNKEAKNRELMFNTEFVPGENLSNKNYNWDKKDGYYVSSNHEMYSSYFFNPEDEKLNIIDKMRLHGKKFVKYLDGGSACHINLAEHASFEQYRHLLRVASKEGTNYFTFNVRNTLCNDCQSISKHTLSECNNCGGTNLDYLTRIIGYLKQVSSYSEPRQREENIRTYSEIKNEVQC